MSLHFIQVDRQDCSSGFSICDVLNEKVNPVGEDKTRTLGVGTDDIFLKLKKDTHRIIKS